MIVTGMLLFLAEAEKCYGNMAFRIKILLLILARVNPLIFHATIYRKIVAFSE
jgi:hypothetical protein